MDVDYHNPGAYFPYRPVPYGLVPPSPTPSVCSEPIYQVTLPNSHCASPGIQLMTPKMSFMNPTASGRNNMVVQPGVTNIFQLGSTFSGQLSESESSIQRGRMSMSPQYRFTPSYCFLQSTPAQSDSTMNDMPANNTNLLKSSQRKLFVGANRRNEQKQKQYETGSALSGWDTNWGHMNKARPQDETINVYVTAQETDSVNRASNQAMAKNCSGRKFEDGSGSKSDQNLGTDGSKKEVISTADDMKITKKEMIQTAVDVKNQAIRKRKLLARKQRKWVQKKNKSLHKTELCTHWTLTSICSFKGKCYFAHGIEELKKRSRCGNYKTQPCVECPIEDGRCLFGSRCNYCHPGEAIRKVVGSTYFDVDYYKDLKKEFSENNYPFGIFV